MISAGILLILTDFGIETQFATLRHPESIDPFNQQTTTRQVLQMEPTLRAEGKYLTLLSNGMLYRKRGITGGTRKNTSCSLGPIS